jgi:hypothetical protein
MASIQNRNGCLYAYESRREGSRVRRVYLGSGGIAQAEASLARPDRVRREESRAEAGRIRAEERAIVGAGRKVDEAVNGAMGSLGFHRPDRGRWRKRRGPAMDQATTTKAAATTLAKAETRHRGFMAEAQERLVIAAESNGDEAFKAKVKAEVAEVRAELAGPDPTPIERLLADRAAACYLDLQLCEVRCHIARQKGNDALRDTLDKRLTRSHNRYLSALTALARVRRLKLPPMVFRGPNAVMVKG